MQVARTSGAERAPTWALVAPPGESSAQERAKFQGTWVLVYWLYNGEERPTTEARITFTFTGAHFVIHRGDAVIETGEIEGLDPDQTPKAFTYAPTTVNGEPFRTKFPAIYWLQDDVLIACVGYRGERPGTFSAEAGSNCELVIYKRVRG
jgi:uncharacterized protein (TIGR03067 family)